MPRYALTLGYITDITYSGFNHQLHDRRNIFTLVCNALTKARLVQSEEKVVFASRTDRGVGALNQVVAFDSANPPILPEINSFLPSGIRVLGYTQVSDKFNPRNDALLRTYSYFLVTHDGYDLVQLEDSFNTLCGTHNIQKFCKTDPKKTKNPKRTIAETTLLHIDHNILQLRISSQSFLWQQVRRIIGHLIEVATTELNVSDTLALLTDFSIKTKPPSAPPEGLILEKIDYRDLSFTFIKKSLNSFQKTLSENIDYYRRQLTVNKYILDSLSE